MCVYNMFYHGQPDTRPLNTIRLCAGTAYELAEYTIPVGLWNAESLVLDPNHDVVSGFHLDANCRAIA